MTENGHLEQLRQEARALNTDLTSPGYTQQVQKRIKARLEAERGAEMPSWYEGFARAAGAVAGALGFIQDVVLERIIPVVALLPLFVAEVARVNDGIALFDEWRAGLFALATVAMYFCLLISWATGQRGFWLIVVTFGLGVFIVAAGTIGSLRDEIVQAASEAVGNSGANNDALVRLKIILAGLLTSALLLASHWVVGRLHDMNAPIREQLAHFFGKEVDVEVIAQQVEKEYLLLIIERKRARLNERNALPSLPPSTSSTPTSPTSSPNSEEDTEEVITVQ